MSKYCPNPNNEDFKEIVNIFDENIAYALWDMNKGFGPRYTYKGEESALFNRLLEQTGSFKDAVIVKYKIYTDTFKQRFGDWINGDSDKRILDSRGEPNINYENGSVKIRYNKLTDKNRKLEVLNRHKNKVEQFLNGVPHHITKEELQNYFRYYKAVSPMKFKGTDVYTVNRTPEGQTQGTREQLVKNIRLVRKVNEAIYDKYGFTPIEFTTQFGGGVIFHQDLIDQMNQKTFAENPSLGTIIKDIKSQIEPGQQLDMFDRKDYSVNNIGVESYESHSRKIEYIKRVLADKLAITVLEDTEMEESGKLLSSSDPRSKDAPGPVIVINPDRLYEDTIFHEVAHLYIELAGGLSNPRIRAAISKLRDTELWNQVSEAYSELPPDRLSKEVLATAVGLETNDIFNSDFKRNWWNDFLDWFFTLIGIKVNKDKDIVKSLAQDVYLGNFENTRGTITYSENLKRRMSKEDRQRIEKIQKKTISLENLYQDSIEKLDLKVRLLKNKKGDYSNFIERIQDLKEEMEVLSKQSYALALRRFIDDANIVMSSRLDSLANIDWNDEKNRLMSETIDDMYLHNIQSYLGTYNMLPQIIETLRNDEGFKKAFGSSEELTSAINQLQDINSNYNRLLNIINNHIKQRAIFNLASYSNRSQGKAIRRFEREANELFVGIKDKDEKQRRKKAYINKNLQAIKQELFNEDLEYYTKIFDEGLKDVGNLPSYLSDAKNINSLVVQVFDKIIDEVDINIREFAQKNRLEYYELFKTLEDHSSNSLEFYKNIIEFDDEGKPTGYLKGAYKSQFYKEYKEKMSKHKELINEFGEESPEVTDYVEKEFKPWVNKNVIKSNGKNYPHPKWRTNFTKEHLSVQDEKLYDFFLSKIHSSDEKLRKNDKLHKKFGGASFFMIPVIGKDNIYEMGYSGVKENVKGVFNNMFKHQGDDEGLIIDESEKDKGTSNVFRVFADEANREILNAPVYFRSRKNLSPTQQSYDLLTAFFMNDVMAENFSQKTNIIPSLDIIMSSVENSSFKQKKRGKWLVNMNRKSEKPIVISGKESNTHKVLNSIFEDRILGMKSVYAGEIFGLDVNKLTSQIAGWTAGAMLGFNYMAATVNIFQGTLSNWIYNASRGDITKKDWLNGEKKFWNDVSGWSGDIGKIQPNSMTNLIGEKLNVFSDFKSLYNRFSENNMFKTLLKRDKMFFLNHAGEFYMQSTLMYTLMSKIKVMNKDGKFIDQDGKVVKTEQEAASLADMWERDGGSVKIKDVVKYTTFDTVNEVSEVAISNYIKDVLADLHGQYDSDKQSMFQRTFIGKLIMMLRKWVVRGVERRFRGLDDVGKSYDELDGDEEFYSESTMEFKEGTYVALGRFLNQLLKKSAEEMSFKLKYQTNWNKLTDYEKSLIRQSVMEIGLYLTMLASSVILYGLAKEALDEDEKKFLYFLTFTTRRLYSEFAFYTLPTEWLIILRTPAASLSFLGQVTDVLQQLNDPFEQYERGDRKGNYKLFKEAGDVMPIINQLNKNIEHSTEYIFSGI